MVESLLLGGPCDGLRVDLTQASETLELLTGPDGTERVQYLRVTLPGLPVSLAVYRHTSLSEDEVLRWLVRGYPEEGHRGQGQVVCGDAR